MDPAAKWILCNVNETLMLLLVADYVVNVHRYREGSASDTSLSSLLSQNKASVFIRDYRSCRKKFVMRRLFKVTHCFSLTALCSNACIHGYCPAGKSTWYATLFRTCCLFPHCFIVACATLVRRKFSSLHLFTCLSHLSLRDTRLERRQLQRSQVS